MAKGDKKARQKAKRDAKKKATRRRESVSPVKRLADGRGEVECWVGGELSLQGQMSIFAYKRAGGLTGMSCFLIDRGVVGLKDAFVRMNVDRAEIDGMLERSETAGVMMRKSDAAIARRWIAGAVRWTHENGMRLPKDWVRAASILGGLGDWKSADTGGFVMEFAGHPEDLRRRLVAESFDDYTKRADIDFIFNTSAPLSSPATGVYDDDDDDDDDDESSLLDEISQEKMTRLLDELTPPSVALAMETATWIKGRGEPEAAELVEAWRSILLAAMLSNTAMPNAADKEREELGADLLRQLGDRIDEDRFEEYDRAIGLALDYLLTDPGKMGRAVLKHGPGRVSE